MPHTSKCPSCAHDSAEKVRFTAWGGVIGPRILSLVKCTGCGVHYNGRSGRTVEKAIRLYTTVTFTVLIVLVALIVYTYASSFHSSRPGAHSGHAIGGAVSATASNWRDSSSA